MRDALQIHEALRRVGQMMLRHANHQVQRGVTLALDLGSWQQELVLLLARGSLEKVPDVGTHWCHFLLAEVLSQQGQANVLLFFQVFPHLAAHAAEGHLQRAGIEALEYKLNTLLTSRCKGTVS